VSSEFLLIDFVASLKWLSVILDCRSDASSRHPIGAAPLEASAGRTPL